MSNAPQKKPATFDFSPYWKWIAIIATILLIISALSFIVKKKNEERLDDAIARVINEMRLKGGDEWPKSRWKLPEPTPTVPEKTDISKIEIDETGEDPDGKWSFLEFDDQSSAKRGEESNTDATSIVIPKKNTDSETDYEKQRAEEINQYLEKVSQMSSTLDRSGSRCSNICNQYVMAYNEAAYKYNRGFADAIALQKQNFETWGTFRILDQEKRQLKELLISISSPPTEIAEIYSLYRDMFQFYEKLYYLCTDPPDSMGTFEEQYVSISEQYTELQKQIIQYQQESGLKFP